MTPRSESVVEFKPKPFHRIPRTEVRWRGQHLCEADFEGDYTGPDEELYDIVVDLPQDITVLWVELSGDYTVANTAVYYGEEGGSAQVLIDEIEVSPFVTRYDVVQSVPAGGFLQLGIGDWSDTEQVNGTIHYKVHYSYPC